VICQQGTGSWRSSDGLVWAEQGQKDLAEVDF
jgi:hypothetical protein